MDVVLNLLAMACRFQSDNSLDFRFDETVSESHLDLLSKGFLHLRHLIPPCKIIDRHCERSEAIQSPCRGFWIASSASPPRNDESMILQVGITPLIKRAHPAGPGEKIPGPPYRIARRAQ